MYASRIAKTFILTSFVAAMVAMATPSFAVDCCSFNGGPCNIIANPGLIHGTSPWTGAVCGVTISGVNCNARLNTTDGSLSSGDCITLGAGVTFDMNGRTITCTDDDCGSGVINTASSGSSSKVIVKNGYIDGCWVRGATFTGGTDSTITDVHVDLTRSGGGTCTSFLSAAIFTPRGTISRSSANHGFVGIYTQPGEDIIDTVVKGNYLGIAALGATTADVNVTNVQILSNVYSIQNLHPGTYLPDFENVSMQDAATCHCIDGSNACVSNINDCAHFVSGAGHASFVDEAILP